ncbi:hypothetical protein BGZ83_010589 [Gryganskiella cystojenkinii]|nr:hypothetical protein BGZ83_010589 [Gryganskiella cystojenkinii]
MARPPGTTIKPPTTVAPPPPRTTATVRPPATSIVVPPPVTKTTTLATSVLSQITSATTVPPTAQTSSRIGTGNNISNNDSGGGGGGGMGGAAIGGMVAGVVVILVGSVVGGFLLLKKRRKRMMMSGRNATRNYNDYPDPDYGRGAVGSGSGLGTMPPMPAFRREAGSRPRSTYSAHSRAGSSGSRHSGYGMPPPLPVGPRGRINVESGVWDEKYYGNANMARNRGSSVGGHGYVPGEYYPPGPGGNGETYSQLNNGMFVANGRRGGDDDLSYGNNGDAMRSESIDMDPEIQEKERQMDEDHQKRILSLAQGKEDPSFSVKTPSAPPSSLAHPFASRPLGAAAAMGGGAYRTPSRMGRSPADPYFQQNGGSNFYSGPLHMPSGGYPSPALGPQRPQSQMYHNNQGYPYAARPPRPPPMMNNPPPSPHFQNGGGYYPPSPYGPTPQHHFNQRAMHSGEIHHRNEHHGPRRNLTTSSGTMSNDSSTLMDEDLSSPTSPSPTPRHKGSSSNLAHRSSQDPMLLQDAQPVESFYKKEEDHTQQDEEAAVEPSMGDSGTPTPQGRQTPDVKEEYVTEVIETHVVHHDPVPNRTPTPQGRQTPDVKAEYVTEVTEMTEDHVVHHDPASNTEISVAAPAAPPLPLATKPKQ